MIKILSFFSLPVQEERTGRVVVLSNSVPKGVGIVDLTASCLVPEWAAVQDLRRGIISQDEFVALYRKLMAKRWPVVKRWLDSLSAQDDVYLCCWERTGFCHRFLVAKLIQKFRPDLEVRVT